MNRRVLSLLAIITFLVLLPIGHLAEAACETPIGPRKEGTIVYNADHKVVQVCTGTQWVALGGSITWGGNNDPAAPSGYSVAWTTTPVNAGNQTDAGFQLAAAEIGAAYSYSITSSGGGAPVTGSGTIDSANQAFTGINLSGLPDGTLTVSVILTDTVGNAGVAATDTVIKNTSLDCTDLAVLAAASPGTACSDGSIYAGSLSGTYLITHVSGCGHEPSGTSSSKASATFTPTCSGAADSITKVWSSSTGANEGATSLTDGLANTNQLIADAQRLNPAAAYCYHMELNGKTDWYLPARDELNVLYINRIAIGGFASANYWSSSESTGILAWQQNFIHGAQNASDKGASFPARVRCVRTDGGGGGAAPTVTASVDVNSYSTTSDTVTIEFEPIVFSIVFSEAMTGKALTLGDINITRGDGGTLAVKSANLTTVDHITYRLEIIPDYLWDESRYYWHDDWHDDWYGYGWNNYYCSYSDSFSMNIQIAGGAAQNANLIGNLGNSSPAVNVDISGFGFPFGINEMSCRDNMIYSIQVMR